MKREEINKFVDSWLRNSENGEFVSNEFGAYIYSAGNDSINLKVLMQNLLEDFVQKQNFMKNILVIGDNCCTAELGCTTDGKSLVQQNKLLNVLNNKPKLNLDSFDSSLMLNVSITKPYDDLVIRDYDNVFFETKKEDKTPWYNKKYNKKKRKK